MQISRRTLIGSTAAAAVFGAAGCSVTNSGSGGDAGSGTGEVKLLLMKQAGWTEEDWAGVIKAFEAENDGIKVIPTFVSYEALHDKIVTSAAAGTYDVVQMDVIWPPEFAEKGIVLDVTDRVPDTWKSEMQGGALDSAIYQDKYYGAPCFPSTKLFYYNTEMAEKVGASARDLSSWDVVMKAAKELQAKGISKHPLVWSWAQAEALICDFAQLLGAYGGRFTDDEGKLAFASAEGEATLKFMVDSLKDGTTNPGSTTFLEDDVTKAMSQGDTAFCLNWESTFRDLNDEKASKVVSKIGVMQTPSGPSDKRPGVNGAMAFAVTKGSKNQDAAWKVIEYATSQAVQQPLAKSAMPNWKASYTDPEVVKINPEVFKACAEAYGTSILRPQVVGYSKVSQILQVEIQNALLGKKSPKEALDAATEQASKVMGG